MADFFTFKKKIHDPTVMKPRPFCVKNIQRCIEKKTSLLDGCNMYKFDDSASRPAIYNLMLNGNGETVFQTTDKFQPLPELWVINRAEKMFSNGCSAAVKNKDGHSADKTSMIPMEYILKRFIIKSDDQDLLGNDENTAPHNETSDTHQDVLLCPEVKIVQDIAYEENDFDAETVSSELGKECSLQIVEETNGKEMSVTSLPEAQHVMQMQAENPTSIQNACQTRRNHGKQRLRQKGRQGRGQGYMRDRAASDCGCQKLFKDSKQYFTNGDMENGYHNLVKVLEFKHWSRQHSKIMSKVTAFIIRKLGETCTDDIPDCLQTLSEATYCMIIRGLVLQKKWIQVNAAFQRFCNINGSETMKTFAIIVNIVEKVVKDKMLKSLEEIKLQTVMLMLDIGVSLDKHDGERHAKVRGHLKVALELLKRDCVGDTPMHAAVMIDLQTDNLNLLEKLLCQFDGDPVKFQFLNPKQVDAKGNGLFHLLAKCKFSNYALEAIKMLCARHLDPRLCNNKGKLPVDYIKNANDERKQYLCIDVCPEVPKLENVSIETKSSANENVAQIKIEEKTCANIIETVKSSVGRNNLEIIEEMIKHTKKAKCKASKKFKKTLYTVLPERAMCQALMPSDHTESKLETREGDVGTSMEKKERSKSENNVDRYVVKANKGDENKESEYEDVSIETKSSANEKVAQIKIEEKTCANIIETVKSSVGRNNLEIIEEMIKNMKKAKCKASKKFKKTLYTVLPERAMCQALMPSDHTESKLETREGDVGTSMEKKERSKSENNVDRYVVKANKGDENKESEYEDVSIETKSSANEKVAQIKIEEKTCANIIETVKSSVGRNNLEIIEEMIKNMKKAKCKASKKFKKTLLSFLQKILLL